MTAPHITAAILSLILGLIIGLTIPRKPARSVRKRVSFWSYYE